MNSNHCYDIHHTLAIDYINGNIRVGACCQSGRIPTTDTSIDTLWNTQKLIDIRNNNVFAPVENLMGMFETYVYTKDTFDPAPRIFQECKYFGKEVIYLRDPTIIDGGSVYWKRDIKQPDVTPILNSIEKFK
jgi:hypothetical protein